LKKEVVKKTNDDEDEWGLDLDNNNAKPSSGFGGSRLLGRKNTKNEEKEDDLDNFLDDMEAKRGIETTK
jgi:hypothetical protein